MKFVDRPATTHRYNKAVVVEPLRMPSYSKEDCDLEFHYPRGKDLRLVRLELTKEEAKDLLGLLNEFIHDGWEK